LVFLSLLLLLVFVLFVCLFRVGISARERSDLREGDGVLTHNAVLGTARGRLGTSLTGFSELFKGGECCLSGNADCWVASSSPLQTGKTLSPTGANVAVRTRN
jgi:hypothetical protein